MKVAFFDTHEFEKANYTNSAINPGHEIHFFQARLSAQTASLAVGFPGVCAFVNDRLDRSTIQILAGGGTKLIALRSAGFNHVDLAAAKEFNLKVVRVPEYSPYAVAEHALALIQTLNRKIHKAYLRVREGNFSLDGLVGFDLHGKTVGIVGTGKIGAVMCKIMLGFGCKVLAFDLNQSPELLKQGVQYCSLEQLLRESDIISLHVPLNSKTKYLLNEQTLGLTKKGVVIINTGRGALINTKNLIEFLKNGHIGAAGLDVYEEEEGMFFEDHSTDVIQDDVLARLLTFPNVILTSHQAFLTQEALANIAKTTLGNISEFEAGKNLTNEVRS